MIARPSTAELLDAMARTLADEIVPALSGGAQHAARVVENLCRLLAREARDGGASTEAARTALQALLGEAEGPSFAALVAAFDRRLADDAPDPAFARRALALLRADVDRRLAISRPDYRVEDGSPGTGVPDDTGPGGAAGEAAGLETDGRSDGRSSVRSDDDGSRR